MLQRFLLSDSLPWNRILPETPSRGYVFTYTLTKFYFWFPEKLGTQMYVCTIITVLLGSYDWVARINLKRTEMRNCLRFLKFYVNLKGYGNIPPPLYK